ncbi:hypothetical protein BD410DRAFT_795937 [Rickenella mellea]|uniref:DEK-C domain-containing protein n=1 Tax=Rickenella mellea TaxID=50990 RepID=A0A4Y7PLA6_9AGAM|nr:hypothetical protein BD410DRAFT_795937 [Rickenella mellea]
MYEIINVHTKNHLGLEGDEIMVWHVEELRNANYAIKNGLRFASCGVRPNLDDCITVGAMLRQWIIKETRYKGQYIIQNSDVQLFWGLKDSELGTPITLQKYPTNPKNNWEFHLWKLHEQSGSLTKLVPTFNGSGSQTTVIVITSSSDSPQILPSSITSLISWNSHQNFNPSPSDGEIFNELRIYLGTQSLAAVTRSKARKAIMAKYPNADLTHRRQFLDESYRKILHERDVSDGTIR